MVNLAVIRSFFCFNFLEMMFTVLFVNAGLSHLLLPFASAGPRKVRISLFQSMIADFLFLLFNFKVSRVGFLLKLLKISLIISQPINIFSFQRKLFDFNIYYSSDVTSLLWVNRISLSEQTKSSSWQSSWDAESTLLRMN